jgi:hypothetical protein
MPEPTYYFWDNRKDLIRSDHMLYVKDAEIDHKNEEKHTYQLVLDFGPHKSNVRLFCKEQPDHTQTVTYVAVMGGSCPCCNKPDCTSLSKMGNDLLKQVFELDKFRSKAENGPSLVF